MELHDALAPGRVVKAKSIGAQNYFWMEKATSLTSLSVDNVFLQAKSRTGTIDSIEANVECRQTSGRFLSLAWAFTWSG